MAAYSTSKPKRPRTTAPAPSPGPRIQKAPGGAWHIWPNGQRYFVAAGVPKTTPKAFAPPAPATQSAASLSQAQAYAPDSEAFGQIANNQFDTVKGLADSTADENIDRANVAEALRRLAGNETKSVQSAKEGRNSQGLYFSGILGKDLSDIATEYARQRADTNYGFQQRQTAREAVRHALQSGANLDDAAAIGASVDRDIGRSTDAADTNSLVLNPDASPPHRKKSSQAEMRRRVLARWRATNDPRLKRKR